ncbi:DUF1835 domain-containing protein [Pontibacter diazotrophicus]|uniref:DUF1835 domain-containing protein n=1 Tax=Pontibacter diazotrophicus TaxID=1400979 RepID=A0A3D8LGB2_9BACT|nr:DUF1835 domain-containing protein [Pontibacter diazotrophicus]RDV16376.1 DUF1835 domain-containing protein [Pontibacter diazotrophicus]
MKKLPTLHIINGDASLPAFEAARLPGQVLVWREILSEGPAVASLPEHAFWQKRQEYITKTYKEAAADYNKKVLDELPKLNAAGAFFEVVLWFDADLMCQVNLLYLLHRMYLLQLSSVTICTPPLPENIGLLKPEELQQLFETRHQQNAAQLEEAHRIWQLYAGPDPMKLQSYTQQHQEVQPPFGKAMALHLSRFPGCKTGLGQPELGLLELIQQGANTKKQLMQQFWKSYPEYGFGDWQLLQLLQRLQPQLVDDNGLLTMSPLGIQVLQNEATVIPKEYWLGGIKINGATNNLCYNTLLQQLQNSSSL